MNKLVIAFTLLMQMNLAWSGNPNFYANKEIQSRYPEAFATDSSTVFFHRVLNETSKNERDLLVKAIQKRTDLLQSIIHFNELNTEEQVKTLRKIFAIECEIMKIIPPKLIIDEESIPGFAFFEFDFKVGGAGKVFLNKKKLISEKNKSEFIILLLHETRHSAQFQMAQKSYSNVLAAGYEASFKAQKELKDQGHKFSFCDFMLLLNEFEAFQFANYVYGSLIQWNTSINDMGTLASQYDENGNIRLNLLSILSQNEQDPINLFNQLELAQYKALYE